MESTIRCAAEACGGLSELARLMGVSLQVLNNWRSRGVPVERCAALEQVSCGRVRRWDMRPADWHRIWPELVGSQGAPASPQEEAA